MSDIVSYSYLNWKDWEMEEIFAEIGANVNFCDLIKILQGHFSRSSGWRKGFCAPGISFRFFRFLLSLPVIFYWHHNYQIPEDMIFWDTDRLLYAMLEVCCWWCVSLPWLQLCSAKQGGSHTRPPSCWEPPTLTTPHLHILTSLTPPARKNQRWVPAVIKKAQLFKQLEGTQRGLVGGIHQYI